MNVKPTFILSITTKMKKFPLSYDLTDFGKYISNVFKFSHNMNKVDENTK